MNRYFYCFVALSYRQKFKSIVCAFKQLCENYLPFGCKLQLLKALELHNYRIASSSNKTDKHYTIIYVYIDMIMFLNYYENEPPTNIVLNYIVYLKVFYFYL